MPIFSNLDADKLLRPEGFQCECGKCHTAGMKFLKIGHNSVDSVIEAINIIGAKHPMVVCGPNGYEAAGKTVCRMLEENGITYSMHVIPCSPGLCIKPSEFAIGSILFHFDHDCDLILAVGSGVINDLCKVVSKCAQRPYMIVATAPSMDGYASSSSAMEVNNVKLSLEEHLPSAIICDTGIMAAAPMRMLWAGLGDMMAKFTALCEWKIVNMIVDEYYCAEIAALVRESLKKITTGAHGVKDRNEKSIETIAEGLVLSGIGMAFAGISRPASGLDHYFSHSWEMMALAKGEESDLHGIQVGVGTLLTIKVMGHLKTIRPTMEHAEAMADAFDNDAWEANIRRIYHDTADDIIEMERRSQKNERSGRLARAQKIVDNWDTILEIIDKELPKYEEIEGLMLETGMPTTAQELGLSVDDIIDAFITSRDIRVKYLTSSLIWDIGYMDEFAKWLRTECEK